jgi:hypothetical protein
MGGWGDPHGPREPRMSWINFSTRGLRGGFKGVDGVGLSGN